MSQVTMYSTQRCPFCLMAEQLLTRKGIDQLTKIRVDSDPSELDRMITLTGRRSVPQLFIGERHIGGYDDLVKLDQAGELDALLAA
ncbi:glutaredoxin [Pseudomonas taeanensis MS-3]|mgnify:CR=1 FL=1|jgi:glutaredoxin 3|uniref:Glutaredoxin n=1 Tax=Pseudomonas taeanensis MS-3 TaxID=1395571 RepID=A0A0A1YGG6_9PSED|nr:glutaredoxin 3 [Pseudomonas taeanensis]KFX67729.1 glutaredoxin [Pseudomonas taeanensis MS-3]